VIAQRISIPWSRPPSQPQRPNRALPDANLIAASQLFWTFVNAGAIQRKAPRAAGQVMSGSGTSILQTPRQAISAGCLSSTRGAERNLMDDPSHIAKGRGPTPPNAYDLTLREQPFHGVRALRLNPVDESKMFGRDGILAHRSCGLSIVNGARRGGVTIALYPPPGRRIGVFGFRRDLDSLLTLPAALHDHVEGHGVFLGKAATGRGGAQRSRYDRFHGIDLLGSDPR
jgi:hypothetical protein